VLRNTNLLGCCFVISSLALFLCLSVLVQLFYSEHLVLRPSPPYSDRVVSDCRTYIQKLQRQLKYDDDDDDDGDNNNDGHHYPFRTSGNQVGSLLSLHPRIH